MFKFIFLIYIFPVLAFYSYLTILLVQKRIEIRTFFCWLAAGAFHIGILLFFIFKKRFVKSIN